MLRTELTTSYTPYGCRSLITKADLATFEPLCEGADPRIFLNFILRESILEDNPGPEYRPALLKRAW